MNTMPLEADTRHLIDRSLENLGWNLSGKEKNVFFEQPRTEEERQKLEHKRPDYVLYSKENKTPLIVIEAKRRGERIDKALEQGVYYANKLKAPLVFATDGVFCKAYHTFEHKTPLLNGEELDEFIREALALKFLNGAEINTVSPKVQYDRNELIKIFDSTNNMLRGDGLRAGIERFGEFANILFIKLLTEKGNIDYSCSWDAVKNIPEAARIDYINSTVYKTLNKIYNTEIFTPLKMQDNTILSEIMSNLDPLTLTDVDSDVKGDAFEYFLKASTASGNDLGEYFTPRHIVKTMVRLVNPQIGEKVYDPFCGTGGFLIESFRYIHNNMPRNEFTEKTLRENTIFGNEITNTARITKMNMILAGDGHSGIHKKDSLANPVHGEYDVVLANMPYSQKTKHSWMYDIPTKNGDSVCVQHCMKAINAASENGRMALVVPEGFLFRSDLAKTREYLLERSELQSIISLPQGVFLPYTGVKTNIIFATKVHQKIPKLQKRKKYWYFDVKSDGYSLDNYRRKLNTPSDLQKYEEYRKLDETQKDEMLDVGFQVISLDKVRENDFNFVGNRYKITPIYNSKYPFKQLKEICEIIAGQSPSSENYNEIGEGLPFYQGNKDFGEIYIKLPTKWTTEITKTAQKNDVLISVRAPVGDVNICNLPLCIGRGLMALHCSDKILPMFLLYILKNNKHSWDNLCTGSTFKGITKKDVENFTIPLPPLKIQQQIVEELESYQKIIDGAKNVIENYTPIIKINSHSPIINLSNLTTEVKSGFANGSHSKDCNGLLHLRPMNINEKGELSLLNNKFIHEDCLCSKQAYLVEKDDILFNNTNSKELVGKTCLIEQPIKAAYSNHITRLRVKKDKILPKYLSIYLHNKWLEGYFKEKCNKWIGQAGINLEELLKTQIFVPPLEEQKQIVAQIEAEQELVNANKKLIEIFTKKIHDRINEFFKH